MNNRYCLVRDEDSHWYLIPVKLRSVFNNKCEEAYHDDNFEEFNKLFGEFRFDGGFSRLTFTDPRQE